MINNENPTDNGSFDASNFLDTFKRYGSKAFTSLYPGSFGDIWSFGLTGETYYDFDRPFDKKDTLTIIHFNDVYNVETPPDDCGGVSRFVSAIRQFSSDNPLILFSGDAFNPSILSNFTKGRHMIPFLNILKIQTACVGNHDLDFGLDHLEYLAAGGVGSTRFPWLLSNVFDPHTNSSLLGGTARYHLFEWQGHRVGVIGLVEYEWFKTLPLIDVDDILYKDYVDSANELSALLRSKECELIIALTHMRAVHDERLAREANDLDMILGGHDHQYFGARRIGNSIVVKSGTDFKEFTLLKINPGCQETVHLMQTQVDYFASDNKLEVDGRSRGAEIMPRFCHGSVVEWEHIQVTEDAFPRNQHIERIVNKYVLHLKKDMETVIGQNNVPLETRFDIIRTQETNCGNWIADLMRENAKTDIAFFNAGTIRSDCLIPASNLTVRDLVTMLPMPDTLVVIELTRKDLLETLEIAISTYPSTEGRFLQISGFRYVFDADCQPYKRVKSVELQNSDGTFREFLEWETVTACTKSYLTQGKDGFNNLKNVKVVLNEENFPPLATLVRNYFSLAAMASGQRKARTTATSRQVKKFRESNLNMELGPDNQYYLAPKVENRIVILNPQKRLE